MPALTDIKSPIKGLVLADSGMGKTGMLWSLADAGFKLKIYDADNGSGVLNAAMRGNPKISNIEVNVFTNKLKANAQGFPVTNGKPTAWADFLSALNKWPDSPTGQGIQDWGPDTVAVIDTFSRLGGHALLAAQALENKMGKQPEIQHYGTAMAQLEGTLANLYGDDVKCHVLVLTHVDYLKNELGTMFGLPMSLGEKLSPKVPSYFNTMLALKRTGKNTILSTKPTAMVQTKVESFDTCKDEYIIISEGKGRPGLAEFFADSGWPEPAASKLKMVQ